MSIFTGCYQLPVKHRGFTLVELVAIVLIIGILAVFAAPRFFTASVAEQTYQARLISSLRYMQQRAMQDSRPFNFCYQINVFAGSDPKFGPNSLDYVDGSIPNQIATCRPGVDTSSRSEFVRTDEGEMAADGVQILGNNESIRFNRLGCTLVSGVSCLQRYEIAIQGPDNTRKVCVEPQGYIHACD